MVQTNTNARRVFRERAKRNKYLHPQDLSGESKEDT